MPGLSGGRTEAPDQEMVPYVRKVNAEGGVLTIDVGLVRHVDDAGKAHVICKNPLNQLAALAGSLPQP